jgi:hypothetical protein
VRTVLRTSTAHAKPYNFLASGCNLGDRNRFPVGGDIAPQLDVRTGVRYERRKVLILDIVSLVATHEDILAAQLRTETCDFRKDLLQCSQF